MLSNDTLEKTIQYLDLFKAVAAEWFKQTVVVQKNYDFFKAFFKRENLERARWSDIQQIRSHLHCFTSMAIAGQKALGNKNHTLEHYRNSFIDLAHGKGSPVERVRRFDTDPQHKLHCFGKSAVSELAGYVFPEDFMFRNNRDMTAAHHLGITTPKGKDRAGNIENFTNAAAPVKKLYLERIGKQTNLPTNFEIDQFFSWLYETYVNDDDEIDEDEDEGNDDEQVLGKQYWTGSVGTNAKYWNQFVNQGIFAIGYDSTTDLAKFKSKEEILNHLKFVKQGSKNPTNDAHACWNFLNNMRVGDIIFAKKGVTRLLGYGIVEGNYKYDQSQQSFKHVRKVRWVATGERQLPPGAVMALKTLTNITNYQGFPETLSKAVGLETGSLPPITSVAYWWLNANPKMWNFEADAVGSIQTYTTFNEKNNRRRVYRYFQEAKPGDIMVGYVTSPSKEIVGVCKITKGLHATPKGESIEFKKVEQLAFPISYDALKSNPDLAECEPLTNNQGSLFRLTEAEYEIIRDMIDETNLGQPQVIETFSKQQAMDGLFLDETQFDKIIDALKEKKNLLLEGAPGVGKSFIAKRIAYSLIGLKDPSRVQAIQFHQSYAYEDFIQGYRPTTKGEFVLKHGLFFDFCRRAIRDEASKKPYVFIIDEINRGNLSKIFGELMMLIENDKRGKEHAIPLTYSQAADEKFYIPENLYVIGMMNTADRSLAMVDYALRRRFRFITLKPEFDSKSFVKFLSDKKAPRELITKIQTRMNALNEAIQKDTKSLGAGYEIGHSFFVPNGSTELNEDWYRRVVESEIIPLIQEYWFDNKKAFLEQRDALLA